MKLSRRYLLAIASGLVTASAFPALGWWWAAFAGLALLWWALEEVSRKASFWVGYAAGLAFFLPHLWWTYTSVGVAPWIALSLLEGLAVALFALSWAWLCRSKWLVGRVWLEPLSFAALWVSYEQVRSVLPFSGFPWGRLAFSQSESPLGHLAWLGGAPLVSFATALVAGLAGLAWEALRVRRLSIPALASAAAVAVTLSGLVVPLDVKAESGTLTIAVIQGSVPDRGLDSFNQAREVTDNHAVVTRTLDPSVGFDLVVWPENAADIDPRIDAQTYKAVTGAAQFVGAPILVGTVDYSPPNGRLNTTLLWGTDGSVIDSYSKQHPAPFAEYIPIRSIARVFSSEVDRVTVDMIGGTEPGVLDFPSERLGRTVVLGDVICFEVAYDGIIRDSMLNGAEILFVPTNNANFGHTDESVQQLAMARLRAIETGRVSVQASTVGVSAIFLPDGSTVDSTKLFMADAMVAQLPLRTSLTPAVRLGGLLAWLFMLGPAAVFASVSVMKLRGRWTWD